MGVHFVHRHVQDTVVMLDEGNLPHPWCPRCYLQVPRKALIGSRLGTAQCKKGAEQKQRWLADTDTRENLEQAFHAYRKTMQLVSEFRYFRRLLRATDDDWPAVAVNIRKARVSWGHLAQVLGMEGVDPKVSRSFYTTVTQQVLLFGAETWVRTRKMEQALDAFHRRVARRLTGKQPRRERDGQWFYPSLAGAMKEAGIVWIRTSIIRRQTMVAQFIATRPILVLCEVAVRRPGTRVPSRWWENTGINWKMAREKAAEKEEDEAAEAVEPELLGSDSEPEADTPGGTAGSTGEEASLGASGSSGEEWSGQMINSSGGELRHDQVLLFKYIKGQSLESNIAAALGLELRHPIMSKLWGLGYQTYRQIYRRCRSTKKMGTPSGGKKCFKRWAMLDQLYRSTRVLRLTYQLDTNNLNAT